MDKLFEDFAWSDWVSLGVLLLLFGPLGLLYIPFVKWHNKQ